MLTTSITGLTNTARWKVQLDMRLSAILSLLFLCLSQSTYAQYCPPPWSITRAVQYSGLGCGGSSLSSRSPCLTGDLISFSMGLLPCEYVEWQIPDGTGSGSQRVFNVPGSYFARGIVHRLDGLASGASVTVPIVYGYAIRHADANEEGVKPEATIVITRGAPPGTTSTIDYTTSDGTAKAGIDYVATSGTLTFGPGEVDKTITVPLIPDDVFQFVAFNLSISSPSIGQIVGNPTILVDILNDEPVPEVGFTEAHYSGTEGGVLQVTLSRNGSPAAFRVTIKGDYVKDLSVAFTADDAAKTVDVPLPNDECYDGQRGGQLRLRAWDGAVVAQSNATASLSIADNEPRPTFEIADLIVVEDVPTNTQRGPYFVMTLTGPICRTFDLQVRAFGGTAHSGSDYSAWSTTEPFPANNTTSVFYFTVFRDLLMEPDETFFLEAIPKGFQWMPISGRTTAMCTIVNDDGPPSIGAIEPTLNGEAVAPQSTLHFHVEFVPEVHGVDRGDFAPIEDGVQGSAIVAVDGDGSEYDVVLRVGTLITERTAGTIALRVLDDDTIVDEIGNPLGGPGNANGTAASSAVTVAAVATIPLLNPGALAILAAMLAVIGAVALVRR